MRNIIFSILCLSSLNCMAQDPELLGQTWYLHRVVLDGQEFLYPNEGHTSSINFYEDSFSLHFPECVEVASDQITYGTGNTFTRLGYFGILLGFCSHQSMAWHYAVYPEQSIESFSYTISTESNHDYLVVTNTAGNQAFYADAQLAVESFNRPEISLFFNAQSGSLEFSGSDKNKITQLTIYNQLGQDVLSQNNTGSSVNLDTLSDGVYFARLSIQDGHTDSHKFLKH